MAQWVKNPTSIQEDEGLIPGLAQWIKDRHCYCCKVWHRSQMWLRLSMLWLWHRLAATAPIKPLAQELPYATGVALKRKREEKMG